MKETEKSVEALLVKRVRELGGIADKFATVYQRFLPDRVVTLPGGRVYFVELKAPGGRLSDGQIRDHERRRSLGAQVVVLWSKNEVNAWISAITNDINKGKQ